MARSLLKATDGCGCPRGLEEPNPLCPGAEEEAMNSLDQQEEAGATPTGGERREEWEKGGRKGPTRPKRSPEKRLAGGSAEEGPPLSSRAETAQNRGDSKGEGKQKQRGEGEGEEEKKRRSGERKEKGGAEANRPEAKPSAWSDGGHAVVHKGGGSPPPPIQ